MKKNEVTFTTPWFTFKEPTPEDYFLIQRGIDNTQPKQNTLLRIVIKTSSSIDKHELITYTISEVFGQAGGFQSILYLIFGWLVSKVTGFNYERELVKDIVDPVTKDSDSDSERKMARCSFLTSLVPAMCLNKKRKADKQKLE